MTDKQIIIDGVDVSGCKHYKNRTCIADYCLTDMPFSEAKCELNPNCYYKQLKRKEQECEAYKMEADEGKEINAELNAELEQEKALKETYLACYKAKHEDIEGKLFKLSKTLTEIKEIAESKIDSKEFMAIQCMLNGSVDNKNEVLKQIIQKISECEVEDEKIH